MGGVFKKKKKNPHQNNVFTAWKNKQKKTRLIDRIQIKTRCKPGTTWRGEETPRQPGISACPVHPGDRWLIAFLLAGGIRRQGTVWPRGFFSVSRPGGGGSEGRWGGEPPPQETTKTKALPMLGNKINENRCLLHGDYGLLVFPQSRWLLPPHDSQWVIEECRGVHGSKYVVRGFCGVWLKAM